MERKTVVIDLDGTLANVDHRTHFVRCDKPRWDDFFEACKDDQVNEWCKELMRAMKTYGYFVLIVTARVERCRKDTLRWLMDNAVAYDKIVFVRDNKISTPDQDLKRNWLRTYGPEKVAFVVDDRQRVVEMWREEGVVCLQCYAWEEYKKS